MPLFLTGYCISVSLFSVWITIWDKKKARQKKWRTRESTLFLLAFLGGSLAMYITMRIIHHKTRHLRFMIGLPVLFILHLILAGICFIFYKQ